MNPLNSRPWIRTLTALSVLLLASDASIASSTADRSVFGIELGTRVSLPQCPKSDTNGLADLANVLGMMGKGGSTTCIDPMMQQAFGAMGAIAKGFGNTTAQRVKLVGVRLADSKCPRWLRLGGTCNVTLAVVDGRALGASILPGAHPDTRGEIVRALNEKYGASPQEEGVSRCENRWSGTVTDKDTILSWSGPGLDVIYEPIIGDCRRGQITIELTELQRLRDAEESARERSQPKL